MLENLLTILAKNANWLNYAKFNRMSRDKAGKFQEESGTHHEYEQQ